MSQSEQLITDHIDIWTSAILSKSTSGRGSNKKYELYGITKLRELILELAVRGKLVAQDANDEPASVLLEKIAAEKAQLVKEKKIKRPKKLADVSNDEHYFETPRNWYWTRLNNIGEWGAGATPSRSNPKYYGGKIPWFKSGELSKDYISKSQETITELALKETSLRENKLGDVLLAMYGATIGKASIVQIVSTTNQAVCACTPFSGVSNTFLLILLKAYRSRFINMGAGGAQPNISREKIIATTIALPPAEEQHRIVAKVDELMQLCDDLEQQTEASIDAQATLVEVLLTTLTDSANANELAENWARISEHFDSLFTTESSINALKQTILQLAVMGKLVPQNPNDEPASVLLEKIAAEKAQLVKEKKIKKGKSLSPISNDEKPFKLLQGWEWCRFGVLFKSLTNGLYKPEKFYSDTGVISLRMYNIQDGLINFDSARRVNINDEELDRYLLEEGDLLINRVNSKELVGKTAIIPPFEEHLVYESMNMRGKVFQNYLNPSYLNLFMRSELAKVALIGHAKEAVGQASINQTQIRTLVTPLPPLAEQHRIVAKVDELMQICDQLKDRLQHSQTTQVQLTDALVEQALG